MKSFHLGDFLLSAVLGLEVVISICAKTPSAASGPAGSIKKKKLYIGQW